MAQISEHINSTNHKIHYYDQTIKNIVNLGNKKGKKKDNASPQLSCLHNSLLMSIVETPEKYLSNA